MIGWHQRLNGHEFEQTLGDSEGLGKAGVLYSMGSKRVVHNLATEKQQQKQSLGSQVKVTDQQKP